MALFPAFAGVTTRDATVGKATKELDWLSNASFRTDDALTLHQRQVEDASLPGASPSDALKSYSESDNGIIKRRKRDKKKKKKHHKRSAASSEGSDAGSDTVYPSDLVGQATVSRGQEPPLTAQGSFIWLDDLQTATDRPFCIDRKADAANWEYKSLYLGDIPRYKRKGSSSLGLNPRTQAVSWGDAKGTGKKRLNKKSERYFSQSIRKLLNSLAAPSPLTPPTSQRPAPVPSTPLYIPIPQCLEAEADIGTRSVSTGDNPLGVYDTSTSLWAQGRGLPQQESPTGGVPSGAIGSAASLLAARVEEFNRRLRENPTDMNLWLEFVRFQDELAEGPGPFSGHKSEADGRRKSVRMLLEKKMSILERALESNPSSTELKLARLQLARDLWEPASLVREWRQLVFLHPNEPRLWRAYLLFIQAQFSTFTVPRVSTVYGKCLSTLASVQDGCLLSHPPQEGTEDAMLDIFLQQCHFLRQAGHSEKAIALFQALMDFTFFKPDSVLKMPTKQQVEFFEPFWDSGEPRVGERGARGWKAWMHQQEKGGWVVPNEPDDDEDDDQDNGSEVKDKSQAKWKIWLELETSREATQWLPWRPGKSKDEPEEDCEDPDRQVLFDDVGPSMIRLQRPELRFRLICGFLQFLGLPVDGICFSRSSWNNLLDDLSLLDEGAEGSAPLSSAQPWPAGVSSVGHMTTLAAGRKAPGLSRLGEEFMRLVVEQISPFLSPQEKTQLSRYLMQYEKLKVLRCVGGASKKLLKSQGKRSKKVAKRLLKAPENRNDLTLWREYGHVEWLLGNLEEARKVFDTALTLGLGRGLRDSALCQLCLLYAQLEVELTPTLPSATASPATHLLTRLAEGGTYTPFSGQVAPVSVLKARKNYEHAVGSGAEDAGLVGCYALFQYLTLGVEAAERVLEQAGEEVLWVTRALLLRHHAASPARLRETLTAALQRFPTNRRLWQLYVVAESGGFNAGRRRRFFQAVCRSSGDSSLIPRLFAIRAEQQRKKVVDTVQRSECYGIVHATLPETGLSHRIRALFENATTSECGACCPLLWRMYISFLVSEGQAERARGIFYKALQNIPWAKSLYMDAVQLFPEQMQEFLDLMQEKELRLRLPMEELDILLED